METKEVYSSPFSKVYNQLWFGFATTIAPKIYELYSQEQIFAEEKSLLDVCCGPGHLALYFLEQGFSTVGIDLSAEMLEIADAKARAYEKVAQWIKVDARQFELDQKFGLAVSTYESLNLMENVDELESCCQCVYDHLLDGGIFVFDINTKYGIGTNNNLYLVENDEHTIIVKGYFDSRSDKGYQKFSGFVKRKDNFFEKFEHYASNTVFKVDKIESILNEIGFKNISYFKVGIHGMEKVSHPESEPKVVIYAVK